MHSVLVERSKQMRTGPGPGSLKQADDSSILDAYFTGNDASGSLDHDAGSPRLPPAPRARALSTGRSRPA
jgi:hypothetical protein